MMALKVPKTLCTDKMAKFIDVYKAVADTWKYTIEEFVIDHR